MELTQLNYFRTVARMGNMSRAAQELFITQPNLSRSIARLEAEVGVPLFDHRKGRIVLNDYGRVFLASVELALGELASGVQTVQRLYENSQNVLSLACTIDGFLPDMLREFSFLHPDVGIRQFAYDQARAAEHLLDRTLTLAVTARPPEHVQLAFELLGYMDYAILAHACSPLAREEGATLDRLAGEPLICDATRLDLQSLQELCRARGFEPNVVYEVESTELIVQLLEGNAGVCIMPVSQYARLKGIHPDSAVRLVRILDGVPPARIGVIHHRGYPLPAAAEVFISFLRESLQRESEHIRALGYML